MWGRPILCVWISSSSFWSTSGLLRLDPRRGNGNGSPTVGDGSQGNGSGSHINTIKFMRYTWTSSSPCNNGHLRHQLLCARHFWACCVIVLVTVLLGHSLATMLQLVSTPLRPGGQQPYNGCPCGGRGLLALSSHPMSWSTTSAVLRGNGV